LVDNSGYIGDKVPVLNYFQSRREVGETRKINVYNVGRLF
jgi:hypothetical protein